MADSGSFNEADRLLALRATNILDSPAEEAFDRLTRLAAGVFRAPIALISLVDADRQWFKSRLGLDVSQTDRRVSFCAHALGQPAPLVVPDTLADPRFRDNALVTGEPHIRFYAGAQLRTEEGLDLGTFCVIDREPRLMPSSQELTLLQDLAATTTLLIEQRKMVLDYDAHVQARRTAEDELTVAKERAETAAEAMRALFSRVSHDLRTPLAAVSGFSELLADSPLTAEQQEDVEEIRRAGRDLLVMIDSLLQVSRGTHEA